MSGVRGELRGSLRIAIAPHGASAGDASEQCMSLFEQSLETVI